MNNQQSPIIEAKHLCKSYHDGTRELNILSDVNMTLQNKEIIAILGRSGTGKTSLLNILGLLDSPSGGELLLEGNAISTLSEKDRTGIRGKFIGFVFQHYHLLGDFTALENVVLGSSVGRGIADKEYATQLLTEVGLGDRLNHTPDKLSGGERQRVAIARALVTRPRLLLCDEPTGNLDPHTGAEVMDVLWDIVKRHESSMIMVTHDMDLAVRADRVLRLEDGALG